MNEKEKTKELLLQHYSAYPDLQIQDIFKFVYQSSFGCEHMVASLEKATEYIRDEWENSRVESETLIDALDGKYSRVHLAVLNYGVSAEMLGKLFCESAEKEINGKSALEQKLEAACELVCEGKLPFSQKEFVEKAEEWKSNGYPPVHHSDMFRKKYHPAYRVIANRYLRFIPLNKI